MKIKIKYIKPKHSIIKHQPKFRFVTVETFGNDNRGGIGSAGR